ncbi:MAG: metallophosphoesterase family protein [Spirochaetales bacterium]|nr:metallophosphoesterase family protein [Spirochaetales bacterium]
MRFLVLADIHGHQRFLRAVVEAEPAWDAVVIVGDLTQRGGHDDAEAVTSVLGATGRPILAVPGNMDRPDVLGFLEDSGRSLHGTGTVIGEVGFFGVGGSNPTPFGTPFELSEDEIGRLALTGFAAVREAAVKVLVSHTPPHGCALDRAGLGVHAGSTAVRRFLNAHPVDLCLCGHIHEASGEETVEGVRCCNPGAVRNGRYAVLEIDHGAIDVKRRKITSWT